MTVPVTSNNSQPLKPTGFYMIIPKFPEVSFRVQAVTIPDTSLGIAYQPTSDQDIAHPGDKMEYPPLRVSLLMDESMESYIKLYGWMRDLSSFSIPQEDMATILQRFGRTMDASKSEDTCDVSVAVLNSHNNTTAEFRFIDAFPIGVSGFTFDTTDDGDGFIRFDVQFGYTYFRIDKPKV